MILDTKLFFALNSLAGTSEFLDGVIIFFADHLSYLLALLFLWIVLSSRRQFREKVILLCVGFGSALIARFAIVEFIRLFIHRPRPFDALEVTQLLTSDNWSFPSGHASFFFALSTALYLYDKKWGIGFFIATLFITLSRVIAGIHYPLDILGGAFVGIMSALAVFYLLRVRRIQ